MAKTMKVQAFYNVTYNLGHDKGQSKSAWGFSVFNLSNEPPIIDQILSVINLNKDEVFNLNLTAFTPVDDINFRDE